MSSKRVGWPGSVRGARWMHGGTGLPGHSVATRHRLPRTEGKRLCPGQGNVVEIVVVVVQEREEVGVIGPAVEPEQFGPGLGNIHPPPRLVVAQTLGTFPDVGAQIGVRRHRRAVDMPGIHVGGKQSVIGRTRTAVDAIQVGLEVGGAEKLLVGEEKVPRHFARLTQRQFGETVVFHGDNPLAGAESLDHLAEAAGQSAWPAQSVDTVLEGSGDEFMEASHHGDAGVAGRQGERGDRTRDSSRTCQSSSKLGTKTSRRFSGSTAHCRWQQGRERT